MTDLLTIVSTIGSCVGSVGAVGVAIWAGLKVVPDAVKTHHTSKLVERRNEVSHQVWLAAHDLIHDLKPLVTAALRPSRAPANESEATLSERDRFFAATTDRRRSVAESRRAFSSARGAASIYLPSATMEHIDAVWVTQADVLGAFNAYTDALAKAPTEATALELRLYDGELLKRLDAVEEDLRESIRRDATEGASGPSALARQGK